MPFSAMCSKCVRPSLRSRLPAPITNRQRLTPALRIASSTWWMSFSFHFTETTAASWPFSTCGERRDRRSCCRPSTVMPGAGRRACAGSRVTAGHAMAAAQRLVEDAAADFAGGADQDDVHAFGSFMRSRIAATVSVGASCGTLWPTFGHQAALVGAGELAAHCDRCRGAGPTPSASPCRLIVGTAIVGCACELRLDADQRRIARRVAVAMAIGLDDDRRRSRDCRTTWRSPRRSPRRTASSATTASTAAGRCRGGSRSGRPRRARCGSSTGTRSDAPARPAPASPRPRCPGCCSRCSSPGRARARATARRRCRRRGRPSRSPPGSRARSPSASMNCSRSLPSAACSPERGVSARQEARRAVAAQIGHQHAAAVGGERRRDLVEAARIVGEAVQQDHRRAVGGPCSS